MSEPNVFCDPRGDTGHAGLQGAQDPIDDRERLIDLHKLALVLSAAQFDLAGSCVEDAAGGRAPRSSPRLVFEQVAVAANSGH